MWNRRDAEIERARALLSNRFRGPARASRA
jgi:hypothetical protein